MRLGGIAPGTLSPQSQREHILPTSDVKRASIRINGRCVSKYFTSNRWGKAGRQGTRGRDKVWSEEEHSRLFCNSTIRDRLRELMRKVETQQLGDQEQ